MKLPAIIARLFTRTPAPRAQQRLYAGAKGGRLMFTAPSSSADGELSSSLRTLRDRSRALVRDNVYAKRARTVIVNNVIGTGVGLQAQVRRPRGTLDDKINTAIESAWADWCVADTCHTGGELHFSDFERAAMGQVYEAGEVFIRKHPRPFGAGRIPLGLELIEADRIADDHEIKAPSGARVSMGIEHDEFGRPLAYYIHSRHPNELRMEPRRERDEILRIPADQIIHLRVIDRWPQSRGVPWMHAAITRLNQLGEFEESAVISARIGASKVGFFEKTDESGSETSGVADGQDAHGTPTMSMEAGEFQELPYGYTFKSWDPAYPNETFDPFTRACLRGISAGVGPSYESLSRDYSQSNYSSSRLALLDDRDLWKSLQQWWIRSFRQPLHRAWTQAAVLSQSVPGIDVVDYAIDRTRYEAVKFKPRGWSWVDPTKEVGAFKEAERANYTTKSRIIAATADGADLEDILAERQRELKLMEQYGLGSDTTTPAPAEPGSSVNTPPAGDSAASGARVLHLKRDNE